MKTKLINLHVLFCCVVFFPCSYLRKTNGPVLCATPTIKPLRTPGGGKVVGCYYKMDFIEPRLDIHKLSSRDEQITKASTEHHEQISVFVPNSRFFFFYLFIFLISSLYPLLFCPTTPPDWLYVKRQIKWQRSLQTVYCPTDTWGKTCFFSTFWQIQHWKKETSIFFIFFKPLPNKEDSATCMHSCFISQACCASLCQRQIANQHWIIWICTVDKINTVSECKYKVAERKASKLYFMHSTWENCAKFHSTSYSTFDVCVSVLNIHYQSPWLLIISIGSEK